MSNIGRRVKLTRHVGGAYGATTNKLHKFQSGHERNVCGLKGDYGTVISYVEGTTYVIVDGCDCEKIHGGGCDGLSFGAHFEWADDAPKTDGLCTCDWGIVFTLGCQCGGE